MLVTRELTLPPRCLPLHAPLAGSSLSGTALDHRGPARSMGFLDQGSDVPDALANAGACFSQTSNPSIRLQSTWSDAQRLMSRWGKSGHYDGTCTATDCDYTIRVSDPYSRWRDRLSERQGDWLFRSHLLPLLAHLGWRGTGFDVRFVVQDSKIILTRTGLGLYVFDSGPEHFSYGLGLGSQVRSRLSRPNPRQHEAWILGSDEQLDDHPDYKIGRPGGCLGCENVEFTYTSSLLHADLVRLTAYDLSCLTRLHSCTQIGDLLPTGHDWRISTDGNMMGPPVSRRPQPHFLPDCPPAHSAATPKSFSRSNPFLSKNTSTNGPNLSTY